MRRPKLNNLQTGLPALSMVFITACHASDTKAPEPDHQSGYVHGALSEAIEQTHFSALVRHVDVTREDALSAEGEQVFVYTIEVQEVFRGTQAEHLTYTMFTEPDESGEPAHDWVILTLCQAGDKYEWPGTGAVFPATADLIETARRAAQAVNPDQQQFQQCDW